MRNAQTLRKPLQGWRRLSWLQQIKILGPGLACLRKQLLRSPLVETELKTTQGPVVHWAAKTRSIWQMRSELNKPLALVSILGPLPLKVRCRSVWISLLAFAANVRHKNALQCVNGNAVWIAKTWISLFLSQTNCGTDQQSCCDAVSSQCKSSCFRVGGLHPAIARCGEVLRIGPIGPALRRFVENVQKVQRFIYYEVIWDPYYTICSTIFLVFSVV